MMLLKLTIFQPTLNQLAFSCFQECERELESMMFCSNKANHKIFYGILHGQEHHLEVT